MVKVDKIDKRIMVCLDHNARSKISDISKKTGLSKFIISSRIEKLEKAKVIKQYITYFDINRMGYTFYDVFVKTKFIKPDEYSRIISKIKNMPSVGWFVSAIGEWDLIVCIMAKDAKNLDSIMKRLGNVIGDYLLEYEMFIVTKANQMPYRILLEEKFSETLPTSLGVDKKIQIDDKDKKIMKVISENSRENIRKIGKSTNLKPDVVRYRMKNMEKNRVIQGYKPLIDVSKMGIIWHIILFKFKHLGEDEMNELYSFFKNMKEVFYMVHGVGNWNLMVEFHTKSYEEFNSLLTKVKAKIENYIIDESVIQVSEEIKCCFLPDI